LEVETFRSGRQTLREGLFEPVVGIDLVVERLDLDVPRRSVLAMASVRLA
jgi:hypothetical protein